ncbi:MAG: CAP domain-containing protein [Oscillospiraceae bacterium]|nr:CAP domain-containing protein [Oscillospiraceae bacterium]
MVKMNNLYRKLVSLCLALVMLIGIQSGMNTIEIFATESTPTIIMGDNAPMTRNEFLEWRTQRGIRHISIEGRIYTAGIFFDWANGQSFDYGELNGGILHVTLRPNTTTQNNNAPSQDTANTVPNQNTPPANEQNTQASDDSSPVLFTSTTPILFSYDELTAMIESVPHQNPLDVQSEIILPNRPLTESELDAWIDEYNEMGGVTAFELAVVREINRVREQYGLRPLALDPTLMISARLKTQEFGDLQYQNHISTVHGRPAEAARMFGFEGSGVSEAFTQSGSNGTPEFRTNAERVVGGMLASTRGHREMLLNPNLYSVGFGASFSPNSTGRNNNMSHMFYFVIKYGFNN